MSPISIALATCEGSRFLPAQLESLAGQTRPPAELVVVDDASHDDTAACVREFASRAPFPVRFQSNPRRLGYRENFIRAASHCRGDLIAFCDQDDVWEPRKLEVMEAYFHDPDVLLAYHNATVTDEAGRVLGRLWGGRSAVKRWDPLTLDPWALVPGFAQVFRRSLLDHVNLHPASLDPYWPEEPLAHDQFFLFLASTFGRVVRTPERLVRYRQHPQAVFGWDGRRSSESPPHFLLRGSGFERAARNRLELLDRIDGEPGPRTEAARRYYRTLLHRLEERGVVFSEEPFARRIGALKTLLRDGAYRRPPAPSGLGWKAFLVDLVLGIPFGSHGRALVEI